MPQLPINTSYLIVAFYQFVELTDLRKLQSELKNICLQHNVMGTILLAEEGINGTVASSYSGIEALVAFLKADDRFKTLNPAPDQNGHAKEIEFKYSEAETMPFHKTKIMIKDEIVKLGLANHSRNIQPSIKTGQYIAPENWNDLLAQQDLILIDTRNDFEVALGTFPGAINPKTEKFSEFKNFVDNHLSSEKLSNPSNLCEKVSSNAPAKNKVNKNKKIAMFCTGGIRCEKASAYLLEKGFEEVYQLEGGILKYLEKIPKEESLWQGECFIFDKRRVLKPETIKASS